jgi:hypothetical protein
MPATQLSDAPPPPPPDVVDDNDDGHDGGDDDYGNGGKPIDWVTIATFGDSGPAHLARLRLERADIPVFIADENIGTVAWHYLSALGGIKLQVPRELATDAAAVLAQPPEPVQVEDDEDDEQLDEANNEAGANDLVDEAFPAAVRDRCPSCPRCGSRLLRPHAWTARRIFGLTMICLIALSVHVVFGIAVLVAVILAVTRSGNHRCVACGAEVQIDPRRGFEVVDVVESTKTDRT